MTKKELKAKMLEWINDFDADNKDEWYVTDRRLHGDAIADFAELLNIDITEDGDKVYK